MVDPYIRWSGKTSIAFKIWMDAIIFLHPRVWNSIDFGLEGRQSNLGNDSHSKSNLLLPDDRQTNLFVFCAKSSLLTTSAEFFLLPLAQQQSSEII